MTKVVAFVVDDCDESPGNVHDAEFGCRLIDESLPAWPFSLEPELILSNGMCRKVCLPMHITVSFENRIQRSLAYTNIRQSR